MSSRRRRHRAVTDAEQQLWRHVTRDVTPLTPAPAADPAPGALPAPPPPVPTKPATKPVRAAAAPAKKPAPKPKPHAKPIWLGPGKVANLDRRTAERVRSGRLPIQRRLDLHGKDRLSAKAAVERFILSCHAHGERSLIIVTGKGARVDGGKGVLYQQVPSWLAEPPLRALVLAVSRAQPKDGGEGALYVLLRRDRKPLR